MKKLFAIFGAALMVAAACTKEEELPFVVEDGKEVVRIIASVDLSRTTVDLDGNAAVYGWQEDETISVLEEDMYYGHSEFTLQDAATGTFIGQKTEGKSLIYAVSPSDVYVSRTTDNYEFGLPDTYYDYVPGTSNAVMVGTPEGLDGDTYRFTFRHAAALVKFTYVNAPVGTKSFLFSSDQNINGYWNPGDLEGLVLDIPEDGGKFVYLSLKEPVAFPNQTLDFYVPVPVGEYHNFSVCLLDENGSEIEGTLRSKEATVSLERGDVFVTPSITLPETSLEGSYIIVSKGSKDYWGVMEARENGKGRWEFTTAGTPEVSKEVNLFDSSKDFPYQSNISYKFEVVSMEGGYVLRNANSGKYVQLADSGNAGKEVDEDDKAAYDVFKINADGTWTIGSWRDTEFFSLQYNVQNHWFTFYSSGQAKIYLIPYVPVAVPIMLEGSCIRNKVTLTSEPADAEIHYTLDGSDPTQESDLYTESFSITKSCTLKAKAFSTSGEYLDSDIYELYCIYEEPGTETYYEKVTSGPVTDGQYLIVYEGGETPVAFDGSLETLDAVSNHISVELSDGGIVWTQETAASEFTIDTQAGTLCSASGHCIGVTSNSNGLKQDDKASPNTFSIDDNGNAVIAAVFEGSTMTLRFNKASNQDRFRYYKNSGQEPIALYKLADDRQKLPTPEGLSVNDMTLSWNAVDGAASYNVVIGTVVNTNTEECSYTLEGVEGGYYNVSVVAVSGDGQYANSDPATIENATFGTPTLPAPELQAGICTANSVQVTWTADERATSGYNATLYDASGSEPLAEQYELTNSVTFENLDPGTEYKVGVYAEGVDGDLPYERSSEEFIVVSTTQGEAATIADMVSACPSENFTLTGVTVVGVASTSSAFIGDGTDFALVYNKNGHGLALGDIIDISGATVRYNGVPEFNTPTTQKTGSATTIAYGDPINPSADQMQAWSEGNFDITYISASGKQTGRKVKLSNGYELYLHTTNAATDGKTVQLTGLVYGWSSNNNNFNFFFTSIEEDATAPSLEVTPLVKTWAYNETAPAEFTVTAANGTWDYSPKTLDAFTISRTDTGLTITPNGENDTENDYTGIVTVTLTPTAGGEELSAEISLTQQKNNGGSGEGYIDVLDNATIGVSGTNYAAKDNITSSASTHSSAVYATQSAGGNNAIQLRSNNSNSGIVSTTSGGTLSKVVVTWNSNTADGRTLNLYGSNTAYQTPSDLYNTSTQGTLLGTIVKGSSTELTIEGSYQFIGLRSNSGAMYLDEIQIYWD